jgi:hypothetical protein
MSIPQEVPSGSTSGLRAVIDRIALKKAVPLAWGARSGFTPIKEMEGKKT